MTKTLELIKQDLLNLQARLIENEGSLDQILELELNQITENLQKKADHYAYRIDRLEHIAKFWEDKEREAYDVKKAILKHIEDMKSKIKDTMKELDLKEIKGEQYNFKTKFGIPKLITEPEILPREYYITETITKPDNERIKQDLKSGKEIDGAKLIYNQALLIGVNRG